MTPDEMERYAALAAELERLQEVRSELAGLAAQVYSREGAGVFTVQGIEVLLCVAKNGAPYFAPRSKWSKKDREPKAPKAEPTWTAPVATAPKPKIKRMIINSQVVEVEEPQPIPLTGRVIEVTAALTARSEITEDKLPLGVAAPGVVELLPQLATFVMQEKGRLNLEGE
jgi:hypothetical protein